MFSLNNANNQNGVPQRHQDIGNYFGCPAPAQNETIMTQYRTTDDWRAMSKEWSKCVYSYGRNSNNNNNSSNDYDVAPPAPTWLTTKYQPLNLSADTNTTLSNMFGTAKKQNSKFSIASTNDYQQYMNAKPAFGNIKYGQIKQSTFLAPNKEIALPYFNKQNEVTETPASAFRKSFVMQPSAITTASTCRAATATIPLQQQQKRSYDLTECMPAKLRRCNDYIWNATAKPFIKTTTQAIDNTDKNVETLAAASSATTKLTTFTYAITDASRMDGKIAKSHQFTLQRAWTNALIELITSPANTPEIHIKQTEFVEDIFWITFEAANTEVVGVLRKMVMQLPALWHYCSLRFVSSLTYPHSSSVTIAIEKQFHNMPNKQILTILAQQNRQLCMDSWKIKRLAQNKQSETVKLLIVMEKNSYDALRAMKGQLFFLASTITCNFNGYSRKKSETQQKQAPQSQLRESNITKEIAVKQTKQSVKTLEVPKANQSFNQNILEPVIIDLDDYKVEVNICTTNEN